MVPQVHQDASQACARDLYAGDDVGVGVGAAGAGADADAVAVGSGGGVFLIVSSWKGTAGHAVRVQPSRSGTNLPSVDKMDTLLRRCSELM